MTSKLFLAFMFALLFSACSTSTKEAENNVVEEKVYVTGSNLPQRNSSLKVNTVSKEEMEAMRRSTGQQAPIR